LITLTSGNFASGSEDKSIKIWSSTTESLLKTLTGHTGAVNGLAALSGDGLASAGADGTLRIWSASSDTEIRSITVSSSALTAVATLKNGNVAVALFSDYSIKVYNPNDGAAVSLSSTPTHTSRINFLLTLSNGNLASASDDNTVKIWNSGSGSVVRTLSGHSTDVIYLKEIGSDLASVSQKILISDVTTGSTKTTISSFFTPYSIEYVANKYVTVATTFGYIDFYDTTGKLVKTDKTSTKEIHSQLKLTSGNLVIGDSVGTLRILKF
jgi:WD40 repeat protein